MRWDDDAIFVGGKPHGETSIVATVFARDHGLSLGLVKGGRSRKFRPILQPGNRLSVTWRARLDEQLGVFTAELATPIAERVLDDPLALAALSSTTSLLTLLAERDPHPRLFDAVIQVLEHAGERYFLQKVVRFELTFLEELGFGLDLERCAATGTADRLAFVSPKSGRAVSQGAGEPYAAQLLPLPAFLTAENASSGVSWRDMADGLRLTGFFLERYLADSDQMFLPRARTDFARMIAHRAEKDDIADRSAITEPA